VAQVPPESVQLPYKQGVPGAQGLQAGGQLGAVVGLAGGLVLLQGISLDTGSEQGIALQIGGLGPVS